VTQLLSKNVYINMLINYLNL